MPCDILTHGPCFCSPRCIFPDSTNDTYPLEATNYAVFVVCCPAMEWNCWPIVSASEHVVCVSQVNQCAVEWRKNKKSCMCCNRSTACFFPANVASDFQWNSHNVSNMFHNVMKPQYRFNFAGYITITIYCLLYINSFLKKLLFSLQWNQWTGAVNLKNHHKSIIKIVHIWLTCYIPIFLKTKPWSSFTFIVWGEKAIQVIKRHEGE